MTRYPKISVVTPSYNQQEFIEDTIKSVIDQNYPNLEYIIIDGGSTDGSLETIHKYNDHIHYWVSEKDNGQSDAINKGLKRATGEIVAWLNSDDQYVEDALWHIADIYREHSDANLIIGNGYRKAWPSGELQRFCPRHVAFNRNALAEGLDYVLQPSTFFTKKALEEHGYLREDLNYTMDWELWYRLSAGRVVVTDQPLSYSREYSQTKTSSGGFKRWNEIRMLTQEMTGQECTAGALFFLTETLNAHMNKIYEDHEKKINPFAAMGPLWNVSRELLDVTVGTIDGFPLESDADVVHYVPLVTKRVDEDIHKRYPLTKHPKISVITPSYNQAEFLERTIISVIDQQYPNLEYIVMDGGSTDESVSVIKKYEKHITYWMSEPDSGPADAINKGFHKATGDIIAWLNSDDCLTKDSLWEIASAFERYQHVDVVYGHSLYVDEMDRPKLMDHGYQKTKIYYGYQQSFETTIQYWQSIYMIPQPTVFFRKEILTNYGFPNEQYKFIFDYEFFLRLTTQGIHFHLIDKVQALYRIHTRSKTSGFEAFYPELYRHSRKFWKDRKVIVSFTKYFAKKIRQFYGNNMVGRTRWLIRVGYTLVSVALKTGNPEKVFVRLVRERR